MSLEIAKRVLQTELEAWFVIPNPSPRKPAMAGIRGEESACERNQNLLRLPPGQPVAELVHRYNKKLFQNRR